MQERGGPSLDSFQLPRKEADWNIMLSRMAECGFTKAKSVEIMKERRENFINACLVFNNGSDKQIFENGS